MNHELPYRYPGIRPFIEEEHKLFFGREDDIKLLHQQIRLEQLVVLFGKSGLGKSSLLDAGVLPKLKVEKRFIPLAVRFGLAGDETTPSQIFLDKIDTLISAGSPLLTKAFPDVDELRKNIENDECFWISCKNLQMQHPGKTILLVLDQFEELFQDKFGEADISRFAQLLATLLFGRMPQLLQNRIYEKLAADKMAFAPDEIDLLFEKVNVQVVISIRSDKMSLLNRLKPHLPHILQKTYELKPLSIEQAEDALLRPASAEGDFISSPFNFEDEAREKIIKYLSANRKKPIEAFQLQLICQYCENIIINSNNLKTTINISDLGDLGDLSTIFNRHYEKLISQLPQAWQHAVKVLIEDKLIIGGNRIPLPDKVIENELNIPPVQIQNLVNSRLLRCEPNSTGGFSYELSHDTLVEPIMVSAKKRRVKEDNDRFEKNIQQSYRLQQERDQKENVELEKENKRQAEMLEVKIKAARRQKLLIGMVSLIALLAIGFAVFGFYQMKQAQTATLKTELEKSHSDSLNLVAQKALVQFTDEKVNNLLQKAKNLYSFGEKDLAIKYLKEAFSIDSTNAYVRNFLVELKKQQK